MESVKTYEQGIQAKALIMKLTLHLNKYIRSCVLEHWKYDGEKATHITYSDNIHPSFTCFVYYIINKRLKAYFMMEYILMYISRLIIFWIFDLVLSYTF